MNCQEKIEAIRKIISKLVLEDEDGWPGICTEEEFEKYGEYRDQAIELRETILKMSRIVGVACPRCGKEMERSVSDHPNGWSCGVLTCPDENCDQESMPSGEKWYRGE